MRDRSLDEPLDDSQRGFTLVELIVAAAIIAVVAGMLATILYQLLVIPSRGNAQLTVDGDLRNAGLWLVRDGNAAWTFTPGAPPVYGTFAITRTGNTTATVTYRYEDGALVRERRTRNETSTIGVARHVAASDDVRFTCIGDVVVVEITATSGQGRSRVSASQTFTVTMRAVGR